MSEAVNDNEPSPISSANQDRNWQAPKLMAVGAVALAAALAVIYAAATILGEPLIR